MILYICLVVPIVQFVASLVNICHVNVRLDKCLVPLFCCVFWIEMTVNIKMQHKHFFIYKFPKYAVYPK